MNPMQVVWYKARRVVLSLALGCAFFPIFFLNAQQVRQRTEFQLFVDMFCFESDSAGLTATNIYLQIPYSEVTFLKEGENYRATLDVVLSLNDSGKQVWSSTKQITLETKRFAETVSPRQAAVQQFYSEVPPGTYTLQVSAIDRESKKSVRFERTAHVPDFTSAHLSMSNIMLVNRAISENGKMNIYPNLSGRFLQEDGLLTVFFEIYSRLSVDSLLLLATILDEKGKELVEQRRVQWLEGQRTQVLWAMDVSNVTVSKATLRIDAYGMGPDSIKIPRASTSRSFMIQLRGLPLSITDITKAIEQLRYVARDEEIEEMENAPTEEEKRKLFFEFWKKRDPDPSTPRNELMEEYYDRVAYANQNFTRFLEGWRTDMGMVYIQFGPPENIERHPFEADSKPYEIWYYYKLNREFVFVDESGFGDYRLQYPLRDLWGRIR